MAFILARNGNNLEEIVNRYKGENNEIWEML